MRLFTDVSERIPDPWLRRAFVRAEYGRGTTSPNPLVGCVIVRDGEAVGEGYHARAGEPHAEVMALREAGAAARGATVYVTLEPCAHHGRTPPCADALIAAGVGRVVIGMRDPNDAVSGGGADILAAAGVDVDFAEDPTPFETQNEAWRASLSAKRPFIRVKVALSLDGHGVLVRGRRASITGISGAEVTRDLRARADAVFVGGATVTADDPVLTVRDADGALAGRQPLRVVLARSAMPPTTGRIFTDGLARTLLLAPTPIVSEARDALPRSVEVASYDPDGGLGAAFETLADAGVVDVLVEAGPRLFTALWDAGLVDEFITVTAGGVAGPAAPALYLGSPAFGTDSPDTLHHAMTPLECGTVGDVVVTVWRPSSAPEPSRR